MATRVYEGMFLLDSNRYARDPAGAAGQISNMVEQCGGEMLASRLWSEQKLAYPIEGHRKGTYWITYFRLETDKLPKLRRATQLSEIVLRNMVLKVDDRLVDTLVKHASDVAVASEAPATSSEPATTTATATAEAPVRTTGGPTAP